ncbi:MAG: aminopeptidase [Desulfuromonadales bacterium]|nr:aminopeptidase [Desulfuromonadales bacterium]
MIKVLLLVLFAVAAATLLVACTEVGYYTQCVSGQWQIMRRCRPIAELLADQSLADSRRTRLSAIRDARDFASASLGLPDNGSYRKFADLERPYVVWNVVAAPEFSLEARQWCFPVAGCVSYRGYFDEAAARREANRLAGEGYETDVYGVQAYSTLNWFDDPVLNTFLDGPELRAVALVFHELAHQVVYVADDSRFNEAFAQTVEQEGIKRWLEHSGTADDWRQYRSHAVRAETFHDLLLTARQRLAVLYAGPFDDREKRRGKVEILADTDRAYAALKASWDGYAGYDPWMERGLNNARLASVATYHDLVPAFQGLLAAAGGDLPAFYRKVKELSLLPSSERLAKLDGYALKLQAKAD